MLIAIAGSFLVEPVFPLGDIRWFYVIIICLAIIGAMYFREISSFAFDLYTWPRRLRDRFFRQPRPLPAAAPTSCVPVSVDPDQSQVSYFGPTGLRAEVFITVENGLDVETRLSKLELEIETDTERLSCRFLAFQPDPFVDFVKQVSDISIPARQAIKGWAYFQRKEGVRTDDFERFVFTAQAIGDPKQVYSLEPYDWNHAKKRDSTLIML